MKKARLSLVDYVGIGINGIVGSGIFLLPGRLAAAAGPSSVVAFLACGAICVLIALCFAEVAGMFDRSGGAYLYTRIAFGEAPGFAVGWMCLCTGTIGYAAGARGLASQLARLVPALASSDAQALFAAGFIVLLGVINAVGLKAGARTSDALSVIKLVPLLAVAGVGLWHLQPARLQPFWPADAHAFAQAVFIAVFACSGFEYVAVPAGEAASARTDVPRATLGSLLGATVLYAVMQLALVGSSDIGGSPRPVADAATHLLGGWGGWAVAVAGAVSMAGFCSSSALVGPRLFVAFSQQGLLPQGVQAMHPRLGTPLRAIVLGAGTSALAAYALNFDRLVDLSNVALFAQYLPTCLAVMRLRRTQPDTPRTYRLPWGDLIPALAVVASVAMLVIAQPGRAELLASAVVLAAGFTLFGIRAWLRKRALAPGA